MAKFHKPAILGTCGNFALIDINIIYNKMAVRLDVSLTLN